MGNEEVHGPDVLDSGRRRERPEAGRQLRVERLVALGRHLAQLAFIKSVRRSESNELVGAREPHRELFLHRFPSVGSLDAEGLQDRPRIAERLCLGIRSDEPHRLAHLGKVLRGAPRAVFLKQFPQRGERGVRVRRPLAKDEPTGGLQDSIDFMEDAVVHERRDGEVARHAVEELPMVDDVAGVEHLEPDVANPRVPCAVARDGNRSVREVDRDDPLREDARCQEAREQPGPCADVEEHLVRFRVREVHDLLRDWFESRRDVLVVGFRHPAVFVDPDEGGLVRVHGRAANPRPAIKTSGAARVYSRDAGSVRVAELTPHFKEEQAFIIQAFIVHSIRESGRKGVVLGLSGGVDSALVAKLCADAIGPGRVLAVAMPDGKGGKDLRDARKWAKALGIEFRVVGIGSIGTALEKRLNAFQADAIARGNLRARSRMAILYFIANTEDRVVMGTGNKSEALTGYFSKWGDGGVDFLPIGDLYKTQVEEMA